MVDDVSRGLTVSWNGNVQRRQQLELSDRS